MFSQQYRVLVLKDYFQFMPVYVAEVNRIHGTNYKFEDVIKSFEQSYEVFTLMQKAKKQELSVWTRHLLFITEITIGIITEYIKKWKTIKRYEAMRQLVKKARF